jgi:phytoene dehydrogenase-like protein
MRQRCVTNSEEALMERTDVVVVGGGLAGLAAAAFAARRGARVKVLEAQRALGGRAATDLRDGFALNLGPHALYQGGHAAAVLGELGIERSAGTPPASSTYLRIGDDVDLLPSSASTLVRSGVLPVLAKPEWARLASRLGKLDKASLAATTLDDWLDAEVKHPAVRSLVVALARVASYSATPALMSAGAALEQLSLAATSGVRYLDGGWQRLVADLREVAERAGAAVVAGGPVTAIRRDEGGWWVEATSGSVRAGAVVVAGGGPEVAARLLDRPLWFEAPPPVTASTLDLGLRRVPERRALFGVDRPLYFSTHSPPAELAPPGHALATVMRYHVAGESPDPVPVRAELEEHAVRAGVRSEDVVLRRYLHKVVVSHGLPMASTGGLAGRPAVAVPGQAGVFVAGDWVGAEGQLADASLASGRAAGLAAAEAVAAAPLHAGTP